MFQFPEIVTRRPPSQKPVYFPSPDKKQPLNKFQLYQNLLAGRSHVSPWVPKLTQNADGTLEIDASKGETAHGPNNEFSAPGQFASADFRGQRNHKQRQRHRYRNFQDLIEDFGGTTFPTRAPPQNPTPISLLGDTDVNFRHPLPPLNPKSETIRPRFTDPILTTPSPFLLTPTPTSFLLASQIQQQQQLQLQLLQRRQLEQQHQQALLLSRLQSSAVTQSPSPLVISGLNGRGFVGRTTLPPLIGTPTAAAAVRAGAISHPFVSYLFRMGPPSAQPLVQYTQFLPRFRRSSSSR
jgi:hypothetical protein